MWRASDLSLHVFMELHRFLQIGQTPPQICLIRHLALVLHDLVSGLCHNMLYLITTKQRSRLSVTFKVDGCTMSEKSSRPFCYKTLQLSGFEYFNGLEVLLSLLHVF